MKRLLIFLSLLLSLLLLFDQLSAQIYTPMPTWYEFYQSKFRALGIPKIQPTGAKDTAFVYYRKADSTLQVWTGSQWIAVGGPDATKVPLSRTITINGQAHTLAADPVWTLTKADIGLSNVDNTSDANKPVSGPQQQRLNDSIAALRAAVNQIDVFCFYGQSNMKGRGSRLLSPDPSPNTLWQYYAGSLSQVTDEVGNPPNSYGTMMPSFGIRYNNITGRKVLFVPYAVDGTSQNVVGDIGNGNWSPTGTLYNTSIIQLNAAIAAAKAAGYTPIFKGIVWYQGESDAVAINNALQTKAQYKDSLKYMISRYRADLSWSKMPFYLIQVGKCTSNINDTLVQDAQYEVAKEDSLITRLVSTRSKDYPARNMMVDYVHLNQYALNELGETIAETIVNGTDRQWQRAGKTLTTPDSVGIGVSYPKYKFHVRGTGSNGAFFETSSSYPIRTSSQYQQIELSASTANGIAGFDLKDYTKDDNKTVSFMHLAASKTLFIQVAPGASETGNQFLIQKNDSHRWFRMLTDVGIVQMGFLGTGLPSTGANDALQVFGSQNVIDTAKAGKGLLSPLLMLTPSTSGGTAAEGKIYYNSVSKQFLGYNGTNWIDLGATGGGGGGGGITNLNGQTGATQTFATPGTSGTDINWSSASDAHTLNVPDASATARGVITTGAQTITGAKNFTSSITNTIDADLIHKRATASNAPFGLSLQNNVGQERGGLKLNMASGEVRAGGLASTYFFTMYSSNSERARVMPTGEFNINNTTNTRLRFYVNGSVGFRKDSITLVSTPAAMDLVFIDSTAGAEEGKIKRMKYVLDEYTPTLTNVANIDNSVAYTCFFKREGQYVTVQGQLEIDPTASGACRIGISLPIASNFTSSANAHGLVNCTTVQQSGGAESDATNDRVELVFPATDLTQRVFKFSFTYKIL